MTRFKYVKNYFTQKENQRLLNTYGSIGYKYTHIESYFYNH